jgi:opacity protein-like surface antigen
MKMLSATHHPTSRALTLAACAFLASGLASASAQGYYAPSVDPSSGRDLGFYFDADVGPSFMPDFQSSRFGFPGSFSARPGVRLGVEPGFNFMATDRLSLGAEFETGFIYNYLYSVKSGGSYTGLRGDYYQVPILGNLVLKYHPNSLIVPYVGVGAGGDFSSADIHTPGFFGSRSTDNQISPAVQGMAGVRFRLNALSDVGVGYKFLADFPNSGRYIGTHAVEACFTVRF